MQVLQNYDSFNYYKIDNSRTQFSHIKKGGGLRKIGNETTKL